MIFLGSSNFDYHKHAREASHFSILLNILFCLFVCHLSFCLSFQMVSFFSFMSALSILSFLSMFIFCFELDIKMCLSYLFCQSMSTVCLYERNDRGKQTLLSLYNGILYLLVISMYSVHGNAVFTSMYLQHKDSCNYINKLGLKYIFYTFLIIYTIDLYNG